MKFDGAGSRVAHGTSFPFTNEISTSQDRIEMAELAVDK
jgi:hypothetical protein